ncbi:MAG TPA: sigma 54-interacting transcriptional regulator [Pyrinomonadaceae bacterium]
MSKVHVQAPQPSPQNEFPEHYVAGTSEAVRVLHRELAAVSRGDFSVLLLGETGVGKEHLARLIHSWSHRRGGPFVAVNCAAVPPELFEAEMFGIGKGVATGVQERQGYFHAAERGTLFLDEIGELEVQLQAKLLRVLQDKEVRRVGGSTAKANVRIVAATNADLRRRMGEGTFRADLYYRIAGFEITAPPLRGRSEDIPHFIDYYLKRISREAALPTPALTPEALKLLTEYAWPGNVRELEHELRRLVYLCPPGTRIGVEHIPARLCAAGRAQAGHGRQQFWPPTLMLGPNLEEVERRVIRQALLRSRGNCSKAAKLLGISRNGLAIKLRRLEISPEDVR